MTAPTSHVFDTCPKKMIFGPCGGVRSDGGCEMRVGPCTFPEPVRAHPTLGDPVASPREFRVPRVLTDFTSPAFDADALARVVDVLLPSCDAVLVGEHQNRPDFPPTLLAQLLLRAGARPVMTLACRDRNRIVLEQELRGLQYVGVDTALCVTGDGRAYDVRPDVTQVFDLDGPRLAELAAGLGLTAAVAETPSAPPTHSRAERLVIKQNLGAAMAVLNYVARTDDVAAFMAQARTAGLTIPVIASVALYTDESSVAVLQGLPGIELDRDTVRAVLDAADPVVAGIDAAARQAATLLAIDGVDGVNLSGTASGLGWEYAARLKAKVGELILTGIGR